MISLVFVASAPVLIILTYFYYRDKYEKEPLRLLIEGLVAGGVIVLPVIYFEQMIQQFGTGMQSHISQGAYTAFLVAALVEETFKFFAVYVLIWKNPNFNEEFDGIVYSVFVSLGFALIENISYVFRHDNGMSVGMLRAFTAVPAHAMFGVMMGYRFGLAKFIPAKRFKFLALAFIVPFFFHGIYDFILMSQEPVFLLFFFPFVIYLLWRSLRRMKQLVETSLFKPVNEGEIKVHQQG